jgi:predicted RNA-binding protein Jag
MKTVFAGAVFSLLLCIFSMRSMELELANTQGQLPSGTQTARLIEDMRNEIDILRHEVEISIFEKDKKETLGYCHPLLKNIGKLESENSEESKHTMLARIEANLKAADELFKSRFLFFSKMDYSTALQHSREALTTFQGYCVRAKQDFDGIVLFKIKPTTQTIEDENARLKDLVKQLSTIISYGTQLEHDTETLQKIMSGHVRFIKNACMATMILSLWLIWLALEIRHSYIKYG